MVILLRLLWCSVWPLAGLGYELPSPPDGGRIAVDPVRGALVDEDGRERIFHGFNVVYKGYPYVPPTSPIDTETSFGEADMERLASWGMNNVRLGVSWAGAEPTRGEVNYTYLEDLRKLVDELGRWGVYTYLELHQDVLAERFCGNGIPTWAINATVANSFPQPLQIHSYLVSETDGLPSEADCNRVSWASYYGTKAVGVAFQNLYDNTDGIGDHVAQLWQQIASVFKNCTWLLGYELINEPWAGDHWQNPSLVMPGVADRVNLAPFYKKLSASIQSVDTDHLIMFEPIPWDNFVPAGFNETPLGAAQAHRSVFAYHYYRPPDMMSPGRYMSYRTADAKRLRSAGFLTEFATSWNVPDSSAPRHDLQHTKDVIAAAENFTQSWSGWQYKVFHPSSGRHPMTPGTLSMFHPDGTLDMDMVNAVSQPYARAVAGTTVFNKFTPAKTDKRPAGHLSNYILKYFAKKSCRLPTEVYVNEAMHFPDGLIVKAWPPHIATAVYNSTSSTVQIVHAPNFEDGELITLKIESRFETTQQGWEVVV